MHDNAPSHAAKNSMSFLASIGIFGSRLMNWPPASPDLNPMKTSGASEKNVYEANKQFHSSDDLWSAIVNAAKEIALDRFIAREFAVAVGICGGVFLQQSLKLFCR